MITRKIVAEEFKVFMSGTEIIRELGKYSRKTIESEKFSANNRLTISQLGVLAEHSFIPIRSANKPLNSYKPYNYTQPALYLCSTSLISMLN